MIFFRLNTFKFCTPDLRLEGSRPRYHTLVRHQTSSLSLWTLDHPLDQMLNIRVYLPTIWKRSWSRSVIIIFHLIWGWWSLHCYLRLPSSTTSCELALEMDGLSKWQLLILSFSWVLIYPGYPPGDRSINSQAQTNFAKCINEARKSLDTQHISPPVPRASHIKGRSSPPPLPPTPLLLSAYSRSSEPEYNSTNEQQSGVDLEGLIQSGFFTLKVVGLRKDSNDNSSSTLDLRLKADVTLIEIMDAIKDAGASLTIFPMFSLHVWGGWFRIWIPNLFIWRTWITYFCDRRRFSLWCNDSRRSQS